MAGTGQNVVTFARQVAKPATPDPVEPIQLQLALDDLNALPEIMLHLAVAVELATAVLCKRGPHYTDAKVLAGVREVFQAFTRMFE